ncbi:MAG: hypothetical protein Q7T56_12195 [Nocardioidaceae bacterium]|nr:hypothetical protein [Nocardioidaceae bacterium]
MRPWLRRNRWGLVLVLPLVVVALLASSSRLLVYWWDPGFHEGATAGADGVVSFAGEYDDGFQQYPVEADLRLDGVTKVDAVTGGARPGPVTVPDGAQLWRVDLHVEADPDIALGGCNLALVDDAGTRWVSSTLSAYTTAEVGTFPCVPTDAIGPRPVIGVKGAKPEVPAGEPERPPAYDTQAYVLTPDDARPTAVRMWWILPAYAELPID